VLFPWNVQSQYSNLPDFWYGQLLKWYKCYNLIDALRFDTQSTENKKICVTHIYSYLFNYK